MKSGIVLLNVYFNLNELKKLTKANMEKIIITEKPEFLAAVTSKSDTEIATPPITVTKDTPIILICAGYSSVM